MNNSQYISLLQQPQAISKDQCEALKEVCQQFPYFQSAKALYLKGLKDQESYLYNQTLKITAAFTTDRSVLFDYISSPLFQQNSLLASLEQNGQSLSNVNVIEAQQIKASTNSSLKEEIKKAEAILDPLLFSPLEQNEDNTTTKTILELHKPLSFNKSDTHSFNEWLKLTAVKPIIRELQKTEPLERSQKQKKFDLIDQFIAQPPKLNPENNVAFGENLAKPFTKAQNTLMTETLAKVYVQQKKYKKALQAYKVLILKNPEKSGFFADQIRAIKKLQEKNT